MVPGLLRGKVGRRDWGDSEAAGISGPNIYWAKMGEICRGFTVAVLAVGLVSGETC